MTEAPTRRRVSVLDLPLRALRAIELEVGLPASRWSEAPSLAQLLISVYVAASGESTEEVEGMSLRELQQLVDLEGEESDPT